MAQPTYSRQQLEQVARADAAKYGLGAWFQRQIAQESGFNPNARSSAGAEGIGQFMPATARGVGLKDPFNPIAGLDAAARYDAQLLRQYGTPERALSAYNSGRADAYTDPNFAGGQTFNYVRSILGNPKGHGDGPPGPGPGPPGQQPLAAALAPVRPKTQPVDQSNKLLLALASSFDQPGLPSGNVLAGFRNMPAPTAAPTTLAPPRPAPAGPPPTRTAGHVLPVAPDYKFGRIDQGVDVSQSRPYVSPGSGVVTRIGQVAGGTNQGVYVRLDHPITVNGRTYPGIYVWHTSPLVKPGQRVTAGQPIMSAGSAEVGFATADGRPVAPLVGGLGAGTQPTSTGHDMLAFFGKGRR